MSHYDPTDLRSQDRAKAEAEERNRLEQKRFEESVKWVMSDKRGRLFVSRVLDQTGQDKPSFDTNNASMAMKEGVRWVGIWLKRELENLCFDRVLEMLKEQRK